MIGGNDPCRRCGDTHPKGTPCARRRRTNPITAFILRRLPAPRIERTPGTINIRTPLQTRPQQSPDPPRRGDIPSRPAKAQVYTAFHDSHIAMGSEAFQVILVAPAPHAQVPRGRQTPWRERSNIEVPGHVAYGSLFTSAPPLYGHG